MKEIIPIITTQKTCIEDWKRNSILPYLDQIWFKLNYDKRADTVTAKDWGITYAKLLWIKWIEDWVNEREFISLMLWWSEFIWEFQIITWEQIQQVLKTPIWSWGWKSRFTVLTTDEIKNAQELDWFEFYSKFPNLAKKIISEKNIFNLPESERERLQSTINDWLEWVPYPDYLKEVNKSQWADNAIARMKARNPEWRYAAFEVVESWNTARKLWLQVQDIPWLTQEISTNFYLKEKSLRKEESEKAWDLIAELEAYFYSQANTLLEFNTWETINPTKMPQLKTANLSQNADWSWEYKVLLPKQWIREIIKQVKEMWASKIAEIKPEIIYPDDSQVREILGRNIG